MCRLLIISLNSIWSSINRTWVRLNWSQDVCFDSIKIVSRIVMIMFCASLMIHCLTDKLWILVVCRYTKQDMAYYFSVDR